LLKSLPNNYWVAKPIKFKFSNHQIFKLPNYPNHQIFKFSNFHILKLPPMSAISFFDSKECEWADMTISVSGSPLTKIRALKYGVKTKKEHLYAAGDDPISIQSGNREPTGSFKVLKSAIDAMNEAALAAGGRDITDLVFDIVVFYKPAGARPPQTDTLVGCEVSAFDKGWQQGATNMDVELPFLFLNLVSA